MNKVYTEEQMIQAYELGLGLTPEEVLEQFIPIQLPTDEEAEDESLKQFPYPIDIKDKNNMIIKTTGLKPFNHAKIEKYRRAYIIGAKWMRDKIKGGQGE